MKEALTLALDLAIMHHSDDGYAELRSKVRQLAKEALALTSTPCEVQPEQEPVAWAVVGDGKFGKVEIGQHVEIDLDACSYWVNRGYSLVPCYTAPPKRSWVGLTDEEIEDCMEMSIQKTCRAIEAKLKEKNT